jgi:WD40 repeat protein
MSRHNPDVMYTGTYRLYKGYGHLPNWSAVTDDLSDGNIFGARFHTISTLDESPIDPDQVIVGTTDGNVWVVNPDAGTKNNVSAGLPDRYVSSVKASTSDPNRLFVTQTGYRDNDFTPHIFRSDNLGATWAPIGGNLPTLAINDMYILPGHQDSVIFAATDGGVYITQNGGQLWERLGSGMPFVPVYDLDLNPDQKTLIAGTHARSIMTYPLDSLRIGENSSTFSPGGVAAPALSVTPSPASGTATLTLSNLLSKQEAAVYIADMAGNIVWREFFSGYGNHRSNVDLHQYAPGIYIACAKINGKAVIVKKFVVTR